MTFPKAIAKMQHDALGADLLEAYDRVEAISVALRDLNRHNVDMSDSDFTDLRYAVAKAFDKLREARQLVEIDR